MELYGQFVGPFDILKVKILQHSTLRNQLEVTS